jgi:hypothetical protein
MVKKRKTSKIKKYFEVYRKVRDELTSRGYDLKGKTKLLKGYIRESVYPTFKRDPKLKPTKKNIKDQIDRSINKWLVGIGELPIEKVGDYVNPLLIPISSVSGIGWFMIDDFIDTELKAEVQAIDPNKGLRLEINAGQYGSTGVFDIRDYQYEVSGVRDIVESIREALNNDSEPEWNGQVIVRLGMTDDGNADSYYMQLTLFVGGNEIPPVNSGEEAFATLPEETYEQRKERRKKALELQKEKEQERKKRERDKAKRTRERPKKKEEAPVKETKEKEKPQTPSERQANLEKIFQRQENLLTQARKDYDDGIYTKTEYKKRIAEINKLIEKAIEKFERGGEV